MAMDRKIEKIDHGTKTYTDQTQIAEVLNKYLASKMGKSHNEVINKNNFANIARAIKTFKLCKIYECNVEQAIDEF